MRYKFNSQMNLFSPIMRSSIVKELKGISDILDATPSVMDRVFKDLTAARRSDTGREGMTAEQVLRCAILKQYRELTYEELAFHLEDSDAFRSFARLEMGQYPSKSILQENIKAYHRRDVGGHPPGHPGVCRKGEHRERQDDKG